MQTTTSTTSGPALPKVRFNWIFSADKFTSTPSNRSGMSPEEELALRQHAAVFIYELGTNLKVPHYCINTAVVYMHRFYMINSFQRFARQVNDTKKMDFDMFEEKGYFRICAASLFLACKVEEFPRTLRDVIENTGKVLRRKKAEELTKEMIGQYADDIVFHENILLSTLGFQLMVDHPHPIIIKTIQALGSQIQSLPEKTPRELAQTAYYLATKSILLTSFCVKYPPDLIACFCIHLAAAWLKIEIPSPVPTATPRSGSDSTVVENVSNKRWFHLVNESFTEKQLGELADEFLVIYEKCPDKIKKKLVYQNERPQSASNDSGSASTSSSTAVATAVAAQHHPSIGNLPARSVDVADSVVPQGAARDKVELRQSQTSAQTNRPTQPLPPPITTHSQPSSSSSMPIKRESTAAPSFSSSNRPSMPPHHASSASRPPSFQHPSNSHYPNNNHHHSNSNYNQHSRYPQQQTRPGLPPPNRSSQQQPPLPPPSHGMDRKPPPPSHSFDHPPPPPPPSVSSSNRPPYGSQQRGSHYNNVPPPTNPYPTQPPYGQSHPPALMNFGGEKRPYDPSFDPNNNNKRPRPSSSSSSSQPWNNK